MSSTTFPWEFFRCLALLDVKCHIDFKSCSCGSDVKRLIMAFCDVDFHFSYFYILIWAFWVVLSFEVLIFNSNGVPCKIILSLKPVKPFCQYLSLLKLGLGEEEEFFNKLIIWFTVIFWYLHIGDFFLFEICFGDFVFIFYLTYHISFSFL